MKKSFLITLVLLVLVALLEFTNYPETRYDYCKNEADYLYGEGLLVKIRFMDKCMHEE